MKDTGPHHRQGRRSIKRRKLGCLRPKHSRPNNRVRHRRVQLPATSTSTSGRLSDTSPSSRGKSSVHYHNSTQPLRQPHQHQQPPRRRPSIMFGTLCRPCKLSWTNGSGRRMHPRGRASNTDKNTVRGRNTSCQMTPRSATLSRCPRFRSSSGAHHGPVALTPTPCLSTMGITTPKNSS
jgi:hypothetical protein